MNADIIHDPGFPHGTPDGYRQGCHGSHCPSVIPCRDAHRRYAGDFAFRRAVDAGETVEQIHVRELAAERPKVSPPRPRVRRVPVGDGEPRTPVTPQQAAVAQYVADGLTDKEIGECIGKTRDQAAAARKWLRLPCNPAKPKRAA